MGAPQPTVGRYKRTYSSRSPALKVRVALIRPSVTNLEFSYNVKYVLTRIATPASDPPVPPAVPVSTPPRRLPPPSKLPPQRNSADHSAESHTAPRAPAASAPAPLESQERVQPPPSTGSHAAPSTARR